MAGMGHLHYLINSFFCCVEYVDLPTSSVELYRWEVYKAFTTHSKKQLIPILTIVIVNFIVCGVYRPFNDLLLLI